MKRRGQRVSRWVAVVAALLVISWSGQVRAGDPDGPPSAPPVPAAMSATAQHACDTEIVEFRVPRLVDGRPVRDAQGEIVWEPALAVGSDGQERQVTSAYFRAGVQVIEDNAGLPAVRIELTDEGAVLFADLTGRTLGRMLGIFVDGELISAPTVRGVLTTTAVITGLSADEARDLADRPVGIGEH